jgi:hypothetical protein
MSIISATLLVCFIFISTRYLLLARKFGRLKAEIDGITSDAMKLREDMKAAIFKIRMYEDIIRRYQDS